MSYMIFICPIYDLTKSKSASLQIIFEMFNMELNTTQESALMCTIIVLNSQKTSSESSLICIIIVLNSQKIGSESSLMCTIIVLN